MAQEQGYTSGFNAGFKLQKYQPEVFELLEKSLGESDEWQRGIIEGAAQARKEKEQERLAELQGLQKGQEKTKGQEDVER